MKIKLINRLLLGVATLGVLTPVVSNLVDKKDSAQIVTNSKILKNNCKRTNVDYSLVEKMIDEISLDQITSQNSSSNLTSTQKQDAIEFQKKYLNFFKSNNFSLEEIQNWLSENIPHYKELCAKNINLNLSFMNIEHIISNNFSNSDPVIEGWITSFCWQRGILIAATTAFSLAAAWYGSWSNFVAMAACITCATQCGILQDKTWKMIVWLDEHTLEEIKHSVKDEAQRLAIQEIIKTITICLAIFDCSSWVLLPQKITVTAAAGIVISVIEAILNL